MVQLKLLILNLLPAFQTHPNQHTLLVHRSPHKTPKSYNMQECSCHSSKGVAYPVVVQACKPMWLKPSPCCCHSQNPSFPCHVGQAKVATCKQPANSSSTVLIPA